MVPPGFDSLGGVMGNHTIDCEFCGADQRLFGGPRCCGPAEKKAAESLAVFAAEQESRMALFRRLGIDCYRNEAGYATAATTSLVKFLREAHP